MNKKISVLLGILFFSIFLLNFVSAYYGGYGLIDLRQGSEQVIQWAVDFAEPFLQVLLGGEYYTGYLLFERLLLFLILASIIYLSLKNMGLLGSNKGVLWIITLAVPLIGIRFLDFDWLNTILIQYKILAIALTAALPFVIYFFFLHGVFPENATMRKIGWIFFGCIYLGLWITEEPPEHAVIYEWTFLASLIFLFLDGTISRYMLHQRIKAAGATSLWGHINKLEEQKRNFSYSNMPEPQKSQQIKIIQDKLDKLYKQLP